MAGLLAFPACGLGLNFVEPDNFCLAFGSIGGIEWKKKRNDRVGCFLLRPAHAARNASPNECESCGFVGQPEASLKVRSRACCQNKNQILFAKGFIKYAGELEHFILYARTSELPSMNHFAKQLCQPLRHLII